MKSSPVSQYFNAQWQSHKIDGALLLLGFFVLVFGSRLILIDMHASQMPYWDEWGNGQLLMKSLLSGMSLGDFFAVSNSHRFTFNRIFTLTTFKLNHHQWDPEVMMVVNALIWAAAMSFLLWVCSHFERRSQRSLSYSVVIFFAVFPISLVNLVWGMQTHTYTMILFSLLGLWFIHYRAYSRQWFIGIFSLICAPLTLSGGSMAPVALSALYGLLFLSNAKRRTEYKTTLLACVLISIYAVALVVMQDGRNSVSGEWINKLINFLKTMSWPAANLTWPAFVFFLSPLLLFWQVLQQPSTDHLQRFAISLFGFMTLVCAAIAYSRGHTGWGPAPRYYEFLLLTVIASVFCTLLLRPQTNNKTAGSVLIMAAQLLIVVFSLPWLVTTYNNTVKDRYIVVNQQEKSVARYLTSGDLSVLENQLFRHIPFPHADVLANALDEMNDLEMLPYGVQQPPALAWEPTIANTEKKVSAFRKNGTANPLQNEFLLDYRGEQVIGSYHPAKGGERATGQFQSAVFRLSRPYLSLPIMGYLGFPDLSLKLVDVGSGEEFDILPKDIDSRYAEQWRLLQTPVPRGYYRIEAQDNNHSLWFAFAAPRSMGRLSFLVTELKQIAYAVFLAGLSLMLIVLGKRAIVVRKPPQR